GSNNHGFLYSGGANGQFTTVDRPGAASDRLAGINDSGQLVGSSTVDDFLAETIPASGSTAIFGTAFNAPLSGEFNSDALSDLVWRRPSDGLTEIQFLNGTTAAGGGVIANNPFATDFKLILTSDFNGDGKSDLLWRRPTDGLVEIQFLNGNAAAGGGVIAGNPFGTDFNLVTAGDFNGDGKSGLVWRLPSGGP